MAIAIKNKSYQLYKKGLALTYIFQQFQGVYQILTVPLSYYSMAGTQSTPKNTRYYENLTKDTNFYPKIIPRSKVAIKW